MLSAILTTKVASLTAVTALIGTSPMRWYPQTYKQNPVYPLITYYIIDGVDTYAHSGYSGLTDIRVQLSLWAKTFTECEALLQALQDGFRGLREGTIDRCFCEDHGSDYNETTQVHKRYLDLMIGYRP